MQSGWRLGSAATELIIDVCKRWERDKRRSGTRHSDRAWTLYDVTDFPLAWQSSAQPLRYLFSRGCVDRATSESMLPSVLALTWQVLGPLGVRHQKDHIAPQSIRMERLWAASLARVPATLQAQGNIGFARFIMQSPTQRGR